jgi:hypothetical protein
MRKREAAIGGLVACVPSMNDSWKCKSSIRPDGGEGLAKRKGVIACP